VAERSRARLGLGRTVRELRIERRLSQEELGFRAGLHRTYVGGVERGERNAGWENVVKLCSGLDVPLRDFVARLERIDPLV
jgi:transcriptional regulator with XRE-family HTH domain